MRLTYAKTLRSGKRVRWAWLQVSRSPRGWAVGARLRGRFILCERPSFWCALWDVLTKPNELRRAPAARPSAPEVGHG